MSESTEYWKKLLGDAYDEEFMTSILGESESDKAEPVPEVSAPEVSAPEAVPEASASEAQKDEADMFRDIPIPESVSAPSRVVSPDPEQPKAPRKLPQVPKEDRSDKGSETIKVDFDFDETCADPADNKPIRVRREKRTGCLGGILYSLFIVCVSLVCASLLWMATTDIFGFGKKSSTVEITVPENFDMDEVTETLYDHGIIKYKKLFNLYAKFSHASDKISAGTYQILTSYDYFALVNGLTADSGVLIETDNITFPEGSTLFQIFNILEANEVCSADELWDCAANYDFDYDFLDDSTIGQRNRLEGYMFPDTYIFYVNDKPERVIEKFLDNFDRKFDDEFRARADELGYSYNEIITIASMIEKEAADDSERDLVSSVIYNRLNDPDSFPWLQIDATIYYAIEQTGEEFSLEVDSPYNSYTNMGLPPTPIANPGITSIRAALYPQDTSYYYYALSVSGYHEFFSYQSSFLEFVNSDEYGG